MLIQIQAISIHVCKDIWVSVIFSTKNTFKTLLGHGFLPKDRFELIDWLLQDWRWLRKIYGMEWTFATHVWMSYIVECIMNASHRQWKSKLKNSTKDNAVWWAEILTEIAWNLAWFGIFKRRKFRIYLSAKNGNDTKPRSYLNSENLIQLVHDNHLFVLPYFYQATFCSRSENQIWTDQKAWVP